MCSRQEGWRLEHENLHDSNSPIQFKGIVFNEMKGVFVSTFWPYNRLNDKTNWPRNELFLVWQRYNIVIDKV